MEIRALSWNLFHGRDFPPDPGLRTWRSRLLRSPERGPAYAHLNRDLLREFAGILAGAAWDVALLQECPPRWGKRLAAACAARGHMVLTARNWMRPLTEGLARLSPELVGSWEGGSNLTLVRADIAERRALTIRRLPERRRVALTCLAGGLCLANLHASTGPRAAADVLRAAGAAVEWAAGRPLILGGDLNVRPGEGDVYERLAGEHGLTGALPGSIDQLLGRGLEIAQAARPWPAREREVRYGGLSLRLSDHAPLSAVFRLR